MRELLVPGIRRQGRTRTYNSGVFFLAT